MCTSEWMTLSLQPRKKEKKRKVKAVPYLCSTLLGSYLGQASIGLLGCKFGPETEVQSIDIPLAFSFFFN